LEMRNFVAVNQWCNDFFAWDRNFLGT